MFRICSRGNALFSGLVKGTNVLFSGLVSERTIGQVLLKLFRHQYAQMLQERTKDVMRRPPRRKMCTAFSMSLGLHKWFDSPHACGSSA